MQWGSDMGRGGEGRGTNINSSLDISIANLYFSLTDFAFSVYSLYSIEKTEQYDVLDNILKPRRLFKNVLC